MRAEAVSRARVPRIGWSTAVAGAAGLSALVLLLAARGAGVDWWSTSVPVLAALPASGAAIAMLATRSTLVGVRRGLTAAGLALALWALGSGVDAWWIGAGGASDRVAQFVQALAASLWQPPLALVQWAAIAVVEARTGRRMLAWRILLAAPPVPAALLIGITSAPEPGAGFAGPLLADGPLQHPVVQTVLAVLAWGWMLALCATPVVLGALALRLRGPARTASLLAAVGSAVPVLVVLVCWSLWMVLGPSGMGEAAGAIVLLTTHAIGCVAGAALVAAAGSDRGRRPTLRLVRRATEAVGFLVFAVLAVAASLAIGRAAGVDAAFLVALLTFVVALALFAPYRAVVRALADRADPQLREALRIGASGEADDPAGTLERALATAVGDADARLELRVGDAWLRTDGAAALEVDDDPAVGGPAVASGPDDPTAEPLGPSARLRHRGDTGVAVLVIERRPELLDRALLQLAVVEHERERARARRRADDAAAAERRRLERDLHDGVQARLLGLAVDLRGTQRLVADEQSRQALDGAVTGLRGALEELRAIVAGEAPRRLAEDGLEAALRHVVAPLGPRVRLVTPARRLDPALEALAYFVVCEAVANAVKHASADGIEVEVVVDDALRIRVEDDGRGGADPDRGTGLRGLRERVTELGGRLRVEPREPTGTRVRVEVPAGR